MRGFLCLLVYMSWLKFSAHYFFYGCLLWAHRGLLIAAPGEGPLSHDSETLKRAYRQEAANGTNRRLEEKKQIGDYDVSILESIDEENLPIK